MKIQIEISELKAMREELKELKARVNGRESNTVLLPIE